MAEEQNTIPGQSVKAEERKPTLRPIKEGSRLDKFLNNYLTNGKNGADALRNAGYKTKTPQETACRILKREEIKQHLAIRDAQLKAVLVKDRPQFLLELRDFKERCRRANKLSEEGKAMQLEASILGISTPEQQQQINIFSALDRAKAVFASDIVDVSSNKDSNSENKMVENTGL